MMIRVHVTNTTAAISELDRHLDGPLGAQLRKRLLQLPDFPGCLVSIQSGPAIGTGAVLVLEPSKVCLDALAACRANDLNLFTVEN